MSHSSSLPEVLVVGAGVAGLTAAHELAVRGFPVTVIESNAHPHRAVDCHVGGMARTQWSRFPSNPGAEGEASPAMCRTRRPLPLDEVLVGEEGEPLRYHYDPRAEYADVRFSDGSSEVDTRGERRIHAFAQRLLRYYERDVLEGVGETLFVTGYVMAGEPPELALSRAQAVAERLAAHLSAYTGFALDDVQYYETPRAYLDSSEVDRATRLDVAAVGVTDRHLDSEHDYRTVGELREGVEPASAHPARAARLELREVRLPGEHGYRFFPAFYSHLFDTMRRTPILERVPAAGPLADVSRTLGWSGYVTKDTGRTVFDNLVPLEVHGIAGDERGELQPLRRSRPRSLDELRAQFDAFQREMGFDGRDLSLMWRRFFTFMTSCDRRRDELSAKTWAEFIGLDDFSDGFRAAMQDWPQALVGLRVEEADARTAGEITLQMLLDQLRAEGYRDGTLNGPTDVAWLEPWRRYLEDQRVDFRRGRLIGLKPVGGRLKPVLDMDERPGRLPRLVVLALPVERLYPLVKGLADSVESIEDEGLRSSLQAELQRSDLRKVLDFLGTSFDSDAVHGSLEHRSPLRHYSGLQFYLKHDVRLLRGHIYIPRSGWGLSAISQTQFWLNRPDFRQDYRGIVSVDMGIWGRPMVGQPKALVPWQMTADEVAKSAWRAIREKLCGENGSPLPEPILYHIDDALHFGDEGVERNDTPFLLTLADGWSRRPGRRDTGELKYRLDFTDPPGGSDELTGVVMAGVFMATHTRLTSMEAANESARHAVNAILDRYDELVRETASDEPAVVVRSPDRCAIYPLIERELDDLRSLLALDEKLYARGLPHFMDILERVTVGADDDEKRAEDVVGLLDRLGIARLLRLLAEVGGRRLGEDLLSSVLGGNRP